MLGRPDGAADQLKDGLWHFAGAQRQAAWHFGPRQPLEEALHQAVLERMEADQRQAAARGEARNGLRQHQRHFLKLPIDVNP